MRAFILILSTLWLLADCQKNFTLSSNGQISSLEILEELAQDCQYSLIYEDLLSYEILSQTKPKLNINNLSSNKLLKILLEQNNLNYTLKDSILSIAFLQTKTYEINYISTSRVSSSSTDVVFTQNSNDNIQPFYSESHNLSQKALSNIADSAKSGTKIYSLDESNFWIDFAKEIQEIAYRPQDTYMDKIKPSITINKNAGLVTITASPNQHRRIKAYLDKLHSKIHAQVLIDVHIFTIRHQNSHTSGINWNEFYNLGNINLSPTSLIQVNNGGFNMEVNIFSQGVTLHRIVEFLKSFGQTRSLSNPKVLTLNNQPAIISVGSVLRYTQNTIFQSNSQGSNIQNSSQSFPSVFSGVLLDVTPSIQGEEIILKINPSITRTKNTSLENEPNALKTPPNLSTNQLSSIVKIKNGEKVILGGLISDIEEKQEFKIPILGDIPLLEYLFKYKWNQTFSEEMVIIISPTIIASHTKPKLAPTIENAFKSLLQEAKNDTQEIKQ